MANVLLGVCGGISAYKSCELVREFQRRGHQVRVLMTQSAQQFVTPLTFEALTRSTVYTNMFGDGAFGTAHIELSKWADTLVVAPLTANTLARFAHGQADDFLSTVYLAYQGSVYLAPAMNPGMWKHVAVQKNLALLEDQDVKLISPEHGDLACGDVGTGRMAEPSTIANIVLGAPEPVTSLREKQMLITTGATREYLDPVRFLSSPASGTMGVALAKEAMRLGAMVTLVHGPTVDVSGFHGTTISITSAEEMHEAVLKHLPTDIFVGAAAVADYQPQTLARQKMKRKSEPWSIELKPTPDILAAAVKKRRTGDLVIGFAAETENVLEHGSKKLTEKKVDLMVTNQVAYEDKGFGPSPTTVSFLLPSGKVTTYENRSKPEIAQELWKLVDQLFRKPHEDRQNH